MTFLDLLRQIHRLNAHPDPATEWLARLIAQAEKEQTV
jgi:hypothetical protein